ncbi:unnamed protein product, partial [Coregonus sp. 'balchen']
MGSKSSKEVRELTGVERYMELKDKRHVYNGPRWRKKYGFIGRLDVDKLESMIKQMHVNCGRKEESWETEWLEDDEEAQYPLIALPNPRAGDRGEPVTLEVYRAWTQRDVVRAVEGIVHPKTGIEGFRRDMEGLTA